MLKTDVQWPGCNAVLPFIATQTQRKKFPLAFCNYIEELSVGWGGIVSRGQGVRRVPSLWNQSKAYFAPLVATPRVAKQPRSLGFKVLLLL